MGIVIRQSILTSLISYAGVAIGYINLLYLYPKFLQPEQVGLLRAIQDTAMLFTPFAVFGLGQSIIRFLPHFSSDDASRSRFMTLVIGLALVTYGFFILVFLAFQNYFISFFDRNAADILQYTTLILWLTFILLFMTLVEQYSRAMLDVAFPAFVREIVIRVLQGVLVSVYFVGHITFHQFILLSVIIYLVALLALAVNAIARQRIGLSLGFGVIPRPMIRQIVIFSVLSFVGTSAMILIGKMDSVMVTGMIGFAANAVYTNAFYMATVIEIPKRAITTTASTLISHAFQKQDFAAIASLYRKTSLNQAVIGALLLIGVWANLPNIFALMPRGDIYSAGSSVVLIVGLGKLIDMLFGPSSEIIGLSRYYWFNLVVITILAVVVVVSNYLLIPRFGIEGAAYGTIFALFLYNFIKFMFIYLQFRMQPFTAGTLKVVMIAAFTGIVSYLVPRIEHVVADILVRSAVITSLYGGLVLLTSTSEEVNRLFGDALRRFRLLLGLR